MIVVADSSPGIGLCRIGQFQFLRGVFGRVIVPEAVWREIVLDGRGRAGSEELQRNGIWLAEELIVEIERA
jgi:predicted nucleic acid-binding protein